VRRCGWRGSTASRERIIFWRCAFCRVGTAVTVAPRNPRNAPSRLDRERRLEEILSVRRSA